MERTIKESLHQNRHTLIPYGIPIGFAFLLYVFVVSGQLDRLGELGFVLDDKKAGVAKAKKTLKKEKVFRDDIIKAKGALKGFSKLFHGAEAGERLVQKTLSLSKEKRVKILGMEAGKAIQGEFFDEISLKLNVEGGFRDQLGFIHALEGEKPPYKIENLNMRADSRGNLKTSFLVKALVKNKANE